MNRRTCVHLAALALTILACAVTTPAAPGPVSVGFTPPITPEFVPTAIPLTPTFAGCAHVWGSKELPALSREFNAGLQALTKDPGGLAYAYGENCIFADGRSTFSAMETDFRIGITVKNIKDEQVLGDWITNVMEIVLGLPQSEMEGPRPGRVDFTFKQPDPAQLMVTVPIDIYRQEAQGLKGAELFRFFYKQP